MDNKPMDITPKEREHLSRLRSRPGMFFGHRATITDLELYYFGMRSILIYHNLNSKICIIPDGFLEYLADKYDESANINWPGILRSHESDEYTAFEKFWEHLNDYLAIYGYEPIEKIKTDYLKSTHDDGVSAMFYYDITDVAESYMKTFNSEPWNDTWDIVTASQRITELFYSSRPYRICLWKDNKVIGGLMGRFEKYFDGDVFQLVELWVQPEFQGKGCAKQLLERMRSDMKELDVKRIYLLTMHGDSTEGFYKHNGFITDNGMCVMNLDLSE